jgi:predicted MFS family arabinose efflux permease
MAFQFQTVGSLGPVLVEVLSIEYAALGTLIGLYMLPGVLIALPGGVLGQRFGAKRVVVAGLALMVAGGLLMAAGASFPQLAAGRIVSGVGAVLINVLMTKMVADWFARREIVTAMSLFVVSWPLGIALGLLVLAPLGTAYWWSTAMHLGAAGALVALVLVALLYRDPPGAAPAAPAKLVINLKAREWFLVSVAGAIWALYNVAYIVLVSFAPAYFITRDYSLREASWIVSVIGWGLLATIPASGYLAERFRLPNTVMIIAFVIAIAAAAALPFSTSPVAVFLLIALAFGLPGGLIMALPPQVLRPESRAAGLGVYFTWYYVGMALLPGLAGMSRDVTGSPAAPILFASATMLAALGCLLVFRSARK